MGLARQMTAACCDDNFAAARPVVCGLYCPDIQRGAKTWLYCPGIQRGAKTCSLRGKLGLSKQRIHSRPGDCGEAVVVICSLMPWEQMLQHAQPVVSNMPFSTICNVHPLLASPSQAHHWVLCCTADSV